MKIDQAFFKKHENCPLCQHGGPSKGIRFRNVPAALICVEQSDPKLDAFDNFTILICERCGFVFSDSSINKSLLYSTGHSAAVGKTWDDHHSNFKGFIEAEVGAKAESINILEIGPSSRPLARNLFYRAKITYVDLIKDIPFRLEENENFVFCDFDEFESSSQFDIIVASHVLEHVKNPSKFIKTAKGLLHKGGRLFLSFPNFEYWIRHQYFNAFSVEHVSYLTLYDMYKLAEAENLFLKWVLFQNHSIFFELSLAGKFQEPTAAKMDFSCFDWVEGINQSISNIVSKLSRNKDMKLFLFGASHLSQYAFNLSPIIAERSVGILDNDKTKWGTRLYGTNLICHSVNFIKDLDGDYLVFVPESPYKNEICEQILSFKLEGAHLI